MGSDPPTPGAKNPLGPPDQNPGSAHAPYGQAQIQDVGQGGQSQKTAQILVWHGLFGEGATESHAFGSSGPN